MARKTIVALYDRRSEAEAARKALMDDGFDDLNVEVVVDGGFGGANDGHGGLFAMLTGWGVPHDEAHDYAEGVRLGGALLAVSLLRTTAVQRALSILHPDGAHAVPGGRLGAAATAFRDTNTAPAASPAAAPMAGAAPRTGVYPAPEPAPTVATDRSPRP